MVFETVDPKNELWIVYDGQCPFCNTYVRMIKLKKSFNKVTLLDAREGGAVVNEIKKIPLNLNLGIVLKINQSYFHGLY